MEKETEEQLKLVCVELVKVIRCLFAGAIILAALYVSNVWGWNGYGCFWAALGLIFVITK